MDDNRRYRVIEIDGMTGATRALDNMTRDPWGDTFTREEADQTVRWRTEHITGRYRYEIRDVTVWCLDIEGSDQHDLFMRALGSGLGESDPYEPPRACVRADGKPGAQVWAYTRRGETSPPRWLVKLAELFEQDDALTVGIRRPVN